MIARIAASVALACFLFALPAAHAEGVKIIKEFKGEGPAGAMEKAVGATSYFPSEATFKRFWTATGTKEALPKVDFDKQFVLRVYAREAKDLTMQVKLSDKGDLQVSQTSKDGSNVEIMSYHIVIVSRDGVKTVGGRKIK
jgi:hypothetical protein